MGIVEIAVERPLPSGSKGGTVGIVEAGIGPPLLGSGMIIVYPTILGPPVKIFSVMGGRDVGPLVITPPKKGLGFMPAMGIDDAVCI